MSTLFLKCPFYHFRRPNHYNLHNFDRSLCKSTTFFEIFRQTASTLLRGFRRLNVVGLEVYRVKNGKYFKYVYLEFWLRGVKVRFVTECDQSSSFHSVKILFFFLVLNFTWNQCPFQTSKKYVLIIRPLGKNAW